MGLFDSNKMIVTGLRKDSTKLWSSQTEAITSGYIDCAEYNVLVLSVYSFSNKKKSNIDVELFGYDDNIINIDNPIMVNISESSPRVTTVFDGLIQYHAAYFLIDVSCAKQFRLKKTDNLDTVSLYYYMMQGSFDSYVPKDVTEEITKSNIKKVYDGTNLKISYWDEEASGFRLGGVLENYAVWYNRKSVAISTNGLYGERTTIALNSDNFPSSVRLGAVARVFIMPYSRNGNKSCRIILITETGHICHNYPNRAVDSQGTSLDGDEYMFDESVVWESPNRFTPVKTSEGGDAELINTGCYKYMPGLSNAAYTFFPGINETTPYGNGGFPATKTVTMKDGTTKTLGRFWVPARGWSNNSFDYMGGLVVDEALTVIGTYRSNIGSTISASNAARTCIFTTQDGREWYNSFEFACSGRMKKQDGYAIGLIASDFGEAYKFPCNIGANEYDLYKRVQFIPDDINKEPEHKFDFGEAIEVTSIVGGDNNIVVTTASNHGLVTGDVVAFKKHNGATSNSMDWITNETFSADSGGIGVLFRVYKLSDTTFQLHVHVHNPHTNIPCRHIHSVDRNKDGIAISCGEQYPQGWLYYMSIRESDSPSQIKPWYDFDYIRLNSSALAVQRGMGFYMTQDKDNTIYIGIDNDLHDLGDVVMPEGRTKKLKRSSNGVFKGKLVDIDNQANFENILPAKEVAYFFKCIEGVLIYIGYLGLIAVSYDWGKNWHRAKAPITIENGGASRYGGITPNRDVIIENLIIHLKQ